MQELKQILKSFHELSAFAKSFNEKESSWPTHLTVT